mgnify:CR=1 FL=1
MTSPADGSAEELEAHGLPTTVADARFAKPIDRDLVRRLAASHDVVITIEEGSIGGFGSQVQQLLSDDGAFDNGLKFRSMIFPDAYIDHDKPEKQMARIGLDAKGIVAKVLNALGREQADQSLIA